MNVLDALLRLARCWQTTTGEKFVIHDLIYIEVGTYGTIHFGTQDGNMYRIRYDSWYVEVLGIGGYKRYEKI